MGNAQVCRQCHQFQSSANTLPSGFSASRQPVNLPSSVSSPSRSLPTIIDMSTIKVSIQYANGVIYVGQVRCGVKQGRGRITWPSGAYFEGSWRADFPSGPGIYHNFCTYQGNFEKHNIQKGTYISADGKETYVGSFIDNKFEGYGRWELKGKFLYEGAFLNNLPHGKGKLIQADQSTYEGQFVEGFFQGYGTYQSLTHNYQGYFKQGVPHGHGRYRWRNGSFYQGSYKNGYKDGFGIFTSRSGYRYEGEWILGKRHGRGIEINANGETICVQFLVNRQKGQQFQSNESLSK